MIRGHVVRFVQSCVLRGKPPAVQLAVLTKCFDDGEITREEFLYLLDHAPDAPPVNAPGGAC